MSSNKRLADALRAALPYITADDRDPDAGREIWLRKEIADALAEHDASHEGFTVCIQEEGNTATTHVTYHATATPEEEAIELAKAECQRDWADMEEDEGEEPQQSYDLHVFAVMRGDFDILQWDDQE